MANGDITDPTGGAPNFNIEDIFQSFGYQPSQAEINALAPAFEGGKNVAQTGESAVANYVQAHQQINGAQSLIQGNLQAETQGAQNAQQLGGQYAGQGAQSYQQALQTLQMAPQLFGSLTPDQVNQYLAPLQNQFNYGLGQVQGTAAQRGLAGSSLEAQALAQAQQQFQQNVLSQGLGVGLQSQQNRANLLQSQGGQQYGLAQQQYGLAPQYLGLAGQSAGQNYNAATAQAGLPGQAVAQALAQQALLQQMNPQNQSFGQKILGSLENVGVQDVTNLGQNIVQGLVPQTQAGNTSFNSLGSLTSLQGGFGGGGGGGAYGSGYSPTGYSLAQQGGLGAGGPLSLNPTAGLALLGG